MALRQAEQVAAYFAVIDMWFSPGPLLQWKW
jgi:hypothetical protein